MKTEAKFTRYHLLHTFSTKVNRDSFSTFGDKQSRADEHTESTSCACKIMSSNSAYINRVPQLCALRQWTDYKIPQNQTPSMKELMFLPSSSS